MKRVRLSPVYRGLSNELLTLMGEELKQPLVNIAHIASLNASDPRIANEAHAALRLIDNVLLYRRLSSGQMELRFEPVHVGSVINMVSDQLKSDLQSIGCRSSIDIQHGLRPVDIDRRLFEAGLTCLWQAFAAGLQGTDLLICSAQSASSGQVRVSLLSEGKAFEGFSLSSSNLRSVQPIAGYAGPAVDLLVAKGLFALTGAKVTHTRRKGLSGYGVTLPMSRQIQLI